MKSKLLIIISFLTLLALSAIQGYLIWNTYELEKKTLTIDARNALARIYNTREVDSLSWLYRNDFLHNLENYKKGIITKKGLLDSLAQTSKINNSAFRNFYEKKLEEAGHSYDIGFKKIVTSITLTDSLGAVETLYPESRKDTILLLGTDFPVASATLINNSSWQKKHPLELAGGTQTFDLNFKSSIYMNIDNWKQLIIQELATLLLLSVLLFLIVVGLLYYSIQNLFRQKRIAQIKTDFINNITHELKTPLSTLALATKTLTAKEWRDDVAVRDDAIAVVDRQNKRIQRLIDQVLASSLGSQQLVLEPEDLNVHTFLVQLLNDYQLTLPESVRLDQQIERTGITLKADSFHLTTALLNILNNAVKYGGTLLSVKYSIDTKSNMHCIKIADNGIGIAPKYQKYIFEKFYRVSEKDVHNYKGLGLGLYYTKQVVSAHNGIITISSQLSKGAVFTIKLPIGL